MALYHFKRIVRDSDGDVVPSVTVEVNQAGSETNQAIYSDSGGTAKSNPFTSDADGIYEFWVDEGAEIDIDFTKTGFDIDSLNGETIPWITTPALESRTLTGTAPIQIDGASGSAKDLSADRTISIDSSAFLQPSNDLSDLASASTARTNLGVPGLGDANTYTNSQTIKRADTGTGLISTGSKATSGISARYDFTGDDDGGNDTIYAVIRSRITDATAGSEDADLEFLTVVGGTLAVRAEVSGGSLQDGSGNKFWAPASGHAISFGTESLAFKDAGSTGATEQDWIEVEVGGVTGYIRVFATK